jgi:hypothetical protein
MKCFKCTNKSNNVLLVAANDIEELERVIELADDCHVLKNDYRDMIIERIKELNYNADRATIIFEV